MARKKTKMCLVCGKDFLGSESAFTCGTACRTYMSRLFAKDKKPEYYFIAKGKGQKVPIAKKEVKVQDANKPTNKVEPPKVLGSDKTNYTVNTETKTLTPYEEILKKKRGF
jgi:hypothetical protein